MTNQLARWYFVTVNEGSECYLHIADICKFNNFDFYAFIKHEKDDTVNNEHLHIILYKNSKMRFNYVKNLFTGAHIEEVADKSLTAQYLLHLNDTSKKQYDISDIITNNVDILKKLINDNSRKFNANNILYDIYNNNLTTITDFYNIYGCSIKNFIHLINALLYDFKNNEALANKYYNLYYDNNKLKEIKDNETF